MREDRSSEISLYLPFSGLEQVAMRDPELTIATLGPSGTSSEQAAKALLRHLGLPQENISLHRTFEEAGEAAQNARNKLLLCANAYAGSDKFYVSPAHGFIGCFVYDTPEYGIVARQEFDLPRTGTVDIITHHAPIALLPWLLAGTGLEYRILAQYESTARVAELVSEGRFDYCVTNETSAMRYGLKFVSRTRPIRMLWSIFDANVETLSQGEA